MIGQFGFIVHPLDYSDIYRKFPIARRLPLGVLNAVTRRVPPLLMGHATGIASPHSRAEGWFVAVPLVPELMLTLPADEVLGKIIQAGRKAQKLGAKIIGLGAFTAVVGDAGKTIAEALDIGVTTGNAYTVATALDAALLAADMMGHDLDEANVAILGATGAIGQACARVLARSVRNLTLIARDEARLQAFAQRLLDETGLAAQTSIDLDRSLPEADVIIAVSSAVDAIIEPHHLKPGAVVCDVARPRDVSRQVAAVRDDVLVIEGGIVEVPGDVDFGFSFGTPPRTCMACMAETMLLALEGRYDDYALGRDISVEQIDEMNELARKHGFRIAGLRSFERGMSAEEIAAVRARAEAKRDAWQEKRALAGNRDHRA